jgi:hypothetical protein
MSSDESKIKGIMADYGMKWNQAGHGSISQNNLYEKIIPDEALDCTETFELNGLNAIFTSEGFSTKMLGSWNCNHLDRDVNKMPVVVLWSNPDATQVILHPLGDPGRHFKQARVSHMMMVSRRKGNPVFNEMLPSDEMEVANLKERIDALDRFVDSMRNNIPISECGPIVVDKANSMGVHLTMGVRDWMKHQIVCMTSEFKKQKPGYKLYNSDQEDVADNPLKISEEIDNAYRVGLKPNMMIQGPMNNSQAVSHIHLVMNGGDEKLPAEVVKNYFDIKTIYKIKIESLWINAEPEPEPDVVYSASLCSSVTTSLCRSYSNASSDDGLEVPIVLGVETNV